MKGKARAPAAATILAAFANWKGAAFGIDAYTTATVSLTESGPVIGEIAETTDGDTSLIERCVELVVENYGDSEGGTVRTESEVPLAAGLKSSSAAANATVLATLDALSVPVGDGPDAVSWLDATRIGVTAARDVGVSVTGAFDDATASMLGGVTITDNEADTLLAHDPVDWKVLIWTPPERAYSGNVDLEQCARIAPIADFIVETALEGRYGEAMTVNGLAYSAVFEYSPVPLLEAMPMADGVSLSGSGPSVTAIGTEDALASVEDYWTQREGKTWLTRTQNEGAVIQ